MESFYKKKKTVLCQNLISSYLIWFVVFFFSKINSMIPVTLFNVPDIYSKSIKRRVKCFYRFRLKAVFIFI